MANNQKAEEYLTEVMKRASSGSRMNSGEERSADDIEIPDEKDLHSLEDVESAFESMGDEEFLEMLIRVNEQMEEKNMIPPEFSAKTKKEKNTEKVEPIIQEAIQKVEPQIEEQNIPAETLAELESFEPEVEESEIKLEEMMPEMESEEETIVASEGEEGGTEETLGTKLKEEEGSLDLSNIVDFDNDELLDNNELQSEPLNEMEGEEDLMASLDSIVQEIQDETVESNEELEETDNEYDKISFEEEIEEEKKEKKKQRKQKEKKEKSSFGQKIKSLFFRVEMVQPLTEEEEEEQKQLKAQEKEAKKKAEAEAKKKKLAEKKEAAKQKKEEAAARKAAKPKKEKKPKPPKEPVSPEEIVHIRPMFLVFLVSVAAAIVLSTVTLSDTFGYRLAVQEARNELENGHYEEAFQALNGLELNDSDQQLYESVRILMRVEKQYRSYVNYSLIDMPNEALHSLVKAVENYDKYIDIAENYGIKEEIDALLSNVEYALGTYDLNLETVREWNTLEDTNEYTKRIMACTGSY